MNAFNYWLKSNYLPAPAQLLWFKLMLQNNECRWSEWFVVKNRDLMSMIGVSSEKTAIAARDKLIECGLLNYRKGKKGSPGKYHIVPLYSKNYSEKGNPVNSTAQPTVYPTVFPTVYPTAIYKQNKTENYDGDDDARMGAEEFTPSWLFAQYFGQKAAPAEVQQCADWLKSWDSDLVEYAFFRACSMGQKNLAYVSGVLQEFRRRGINSMGDVAEDDMRHAAGR